MLSSNACLPLITPSFHHISCPDSSVWKTFHKPGTTLPRLKQWPCWNLYFFNGFKLFGSVSAFLSLCPERSWSALCPVVLWATSRSASPETRGRRRQGGPSALQHPADMSNTACSSTANTSQTFCWNRRVVSMSVGKMLYMNLSVRLTLIPLSTWHSYRCTVKGLRSVSLAVPSFTMVTFTCTVFVIFLWSCLSAALK